MKDMIGKTLLLISATVLVRSGSAQSVCDNVVIENVQYSALYPVIEVQAYYDGSDCIDYPSFILYAENGDTLAIETVNFFCVGFGTPQTHVLVISTEVTIPTGAFNARLELFSGFQDTLVCGWDLDDLFLCPPMECQQAEIYLVNPGTLEAFSAYWWITDENGDWVDEGTFEVDDINHTHFDTTCLVPGNYQLGFSPFSPIDESYVIGITTSFQQGIGFNTHLDESDSPWDLSFTWYAACQGGTNAVSESARKELLMRMDGGMLHLGDPDMEPLGDIWIFSADGRLARSLREQSDRTVVDLNSLASGLHVVRVMQRDGQFFARSIIIP